MEAVKIVFTRIEPSDEGVILRYEIKLFEVEGGLPTLAYNGTLLVKKDISAKELFKEAETLILRKAKEFTKAYKEFKSFLNNGVLE